MCSYCGCEFEGVIAELMADHEEVALLARTAESALAGGDERDAVAVSSLVAGLFALHGAKEEAGLFAEMRAEDLAVDVIARLEEEHRRIRAALAVLARGDTTGLGRVLAELVDHAGREDTDLFPAALALLPNDCWPRIAKVHGGAGDPDTVGQLGPFGPSGPEGGDGR